MNKAIKKRMMTVASCMVSAVMCLAPLAACDTTETPTPEAPEHFAAVSATCYALGNIEYWTKDGKYYSDEACTKEISQADTVVAKRSHDFGDKAAYDKDTEGHHWKVCAYTDCDGKSAQEAHKFGDDGTCPCGATTTVTYTVSVATGIANGTVTVDPATAAAEATITVTAVPSVGYELDTLTYNDGTTDHDITGTTFTMPAHDVTVNATFKKATYTVTVATDIQNGDVTVNKATAQMGDKVVVTVEPDSDYELVPGSLKYNTQVVTYSEGEYSFVMPAENVVITAAFRESTVKYGVTVASGIENGTVTVLGGVVEAAEDDEITLVVEPAEGYHLATLKYNDGEDHEIPMDTKKFVMPAKAVVITATFEEHNFNRDEHHGECSCGETNGFKYFYLDSEHATRTDTANSVKITRTTTGTLADYQIKLNRGFDVVVGHYYEISYTVTSTQSGKIGVWMGDNVIYHGDRFYDNLPANTETVFKFGFVPKAETNGNITAELQIGLLPEGFEFTITDFSLEELKGDDISGWTPKAEGSVVLHEEETGYNEDGTLTLNATGDGDRWHLKVEKDITLEANHSYKLTMVIVTSGRSQSENTEFAIYKKDEVEVAEVTEKFCWLDNDVCVKTFEFKAKDSTALGGDSITIGSCLAFGDITNGSKLTFTISYAQIVDLGVVD